MAHAPAGPEDYMIATGETHSVREFAELVFTEGGIEGNPRYYRPTEVDVLIGNPTKAKEKLGWEAKVGFEELVKMMVEGDLKKLYIVCSCNIKRGTYNDSVI